MNTVSLAGQVIEEPVKFDSAKGLKCCRFKLCVDKASKDSEKAFEVFEVLVFNNLAELNFKVGQYVGVIGRLQANNNEKDGKTYYNVQILGGNISFLGK